MASKSLTVTVAEHIVEEWEEEYEEMDMSSRSEYIRYHVEAGRKELSRLHPTNTSEEESLQDNVLDTIPDDEAIPPEEIVEEIVEPVRKQILDEILPQLDDRGEITFSPADGGYKKE